jgi:hypothetical protein
MSTLKLSGITSGSSILKAPDTGSTGVTFTLPASTGTLAVNSDVTNKLPLAGGTMTGAVTGLKIDTGGDIEFDFNGLNAHFTTGSSPHIFAGQGSSGSYLAGSLNFQSRPSGANRDIAFITGTTPTQRMTISGTGNVGIGTTGPSGKLHIQSTDSFPNNDSGAQLYILDQGATSSRSAALGVRVNTIHTGTDGALITIENSSSSCNAFNFDGKMYMNSDGHVGIGTATNLGSTKLTVESDTSVSNPMAVSSSRTTAATDYSILFYRAGSIVGSVQTSLSATSYVTSSDYRLKENVVPMTGSIDRLKELKPSKFNFIVDATTTVDGFLAHEVSDTVPEAITGEKDAMTTEDITDEEGNVTGTQEVPDMQGIDQGKLVPLLTSALQEAVAKIEELTTRIETLEAN